MLRRRRETREKEALRLLKARHHTFRALLIGNERALEKLSALDDALHKRSDPGAILEELLSITFEMVDALNRLSGNRYSALYNAHDAISRAARQAVGELGSRGAGQAFAVRLSEAGLEHARFIGGKAAALGELLRAGFPVPPGFAVSAETGRRFLEETGVAESILRILRPMEAGAGDPAAAGREIRELVMETGLPGGITRGLTEEWRALGSVPVSVRSSALVEDDPKHSFAGQFSSVLNVRDEDGLVQAYKKVVASNFGVRPLAYRRQAGLPLADLEMSVIVQTMVEARAAGVLFTMNPSEPENGRMLLSAVPGLGTLAVGGSGPVDIYQPDRQPDRGDHTAQFSAIARKDKREVLDEGGGLNLEQIPEQERNLPVLDPGTIARLVRYGRLAEISFGKPQDMEWALGRDGQLYFLQSRPIRFQGVSMKAAASLRGEVLASGGVCASSGRAYGQAVIARSNEDLDRPLPDAPVVLVLNRSLVDAARIVPLVEGLVVELGNPTDHLSCVAREMNAPMLTGCSGATASIPEGALIILDADDHRVVRAPEGLSDLPRRKRKSPRISLSPAAERLCRLTIPLNLTDAFGPTFSIQECRTLHDIVRFSHEKALMSLFQAGDQGAEEADTLVKVIEGLPLHFLVIDLGGGLEAKPGRWVHLSEVRSVPLLALCEGRNTPGLRWRQPPPALSVSGLISRSFTDPGGERPVGSQNYALITRDYLNLNTRVDFHFAMVDSVSGPNQQENYIRFRFKGGGAAAAQRERRAAFIGEILRAQGFFTDTRGDLVTGAISELDAPGMDEKLSMLGRLLGFSRLMDAAMTSDKAPQRVAEAFLKGDWALASLDSQA